MKRTESLTVDPGRLMSMTVFKMIRSVLVVCAAALGVLTAGGCGVFSSSNGQKAAPDGGNRRGDVATIQSSVMAFADRYLTAMAEAYDTARDGAPTSQGRHMAQQGKVQAAMGALGNASNPNPLAGLMDMAILLTLTRESTEEPWAAEAFGTDGAARLLEAIEMQEADIWSIAGVHLTGDQIRELQQLVSQWWDLHPGERYVVGVRLADFPQAGSASPSSGLAASVLGIIRLDPFAGLDPAVRQFEQSRVLGERIFFYGRHVSLLVAWQAEALYTQLLDEPQAKQLLADTSEFTQHTGRFADATREFSGASDRMAATVERFRSELPEQQATLIKQLNETIAERLASGLAQAGVELQAQREGALKQASEELTAQRDAALKQAAEIIAIERKAAIEQLNASVASQQGELSSNLRGVLDDAIDRLYSRAIVVVLIAGGAGVVVVLAWRLTGRISRPPRAGAAA